jgi:hypothetical protein
MKIGSKKLNNLNKFSHCSDTDKRKETIS